MTECFNDSFILKVQNNISSLLIKENVELKKKLQSDFLNILNSILDKNELIVTIKINNIKNIVELVKELSLLFPDILNKYFIDISKYLSLINNNQNAINFNNNTLESYNWLINLSYFIALLTINLKQSNQILTNILEELNIIIYKLNNCIIEDININKDNSDKTIFSLIYFFFLLNINMNIAYNIQSYNPIIFSVLLDCTKTFYKGNFKNIIEIENNNKSLEIESPSILNIIDEIIKNNYTLEKEYNYYSNKLELYIINIIKELYNNLSNDINFDILLLSFNELITDKYTSIDIKSTNKENEDLKNKYLELINLYKLKSQESIKKKSLPIMFLDITKKGIEQLNPDWETFEDKTDDMVVKSMKKKLRNSRRQLTRNLKKQSVVINQERNVKLKNIEFKRKEDLKFTNQFIEQTNIESKKLATENMKKRHKLRNIKRSKNKNDKK